MKVVAIVGCPNVGKSTLFNRLTRTRDALVADFPGLTRDRKYGRALCDGREFVLIDTGGIARDNTDQPESLTRMMTAQAQQAIEECDLVLFMADARAGIMPGDLEVADIIRRSGKPCVVVANKVDGVNQDTAGAEFYSFGLGEVYQVAAAHGRGVQVLLEDAIAPVLFADDESGQDAAGQPDANPDDGGDTDAADSAQDWEQQYAYLDDVPVDKEGGGFDWHGFRENQRQRMKAEDEESLPEPAKAPFADLPVKFAIVGKPNVGKSTLTNRLLGEERVIVADFPGTTRDSIYIPLERAGRHYIVIDTAGVRKRRKVSAMVEKFSIVKTLKAITDCNVALLLIDARSGISEQDLSLLGFIIDSGRALVIAVNKWDGLDADVKDNLRRELNARLGFVDFARVHFISALHGTGVGHLYESIDEAYASATTRHSSAALNRMLREAVARHEPPIVAGHRAKLKYIHPGGYNPPRLIVHGNRVRQLPESYRRYLVNFFREALNIMGTPVSIEFHEGENPYAQQKPAQKEKQARRQRGRDVPQKSRGARAAGGGRTKAAGPVRKSRR